MSLNGLAALAPRDWFLRFAGSQHAGGKPSVLAARITPDPPRQRMGTEDLPEPVPRPVGHGPFKCRYCGRYGQPGACAGCGAPNAPAAEALPPRKPDQLLRYHEVGGTDRAEITTFGDLRRRFIDCYPPVFDTVKR